MPDVSGNPDLVVIVLGIKANSLRGLMTILVIRLRGTLSKAVAQRPDGLLFAQNSIVYSFRPLHIGARWYWRDQKSMLAWAHSAPHRHWSAAFSRDRRGTCFWHETFFLQGGIEALYFDVDFETGLQSFLPMRPMDGSFIKRQASSRSRAAGEEP